MILEVKNVYKSFGKNKVLKGASFSVDSPKILALVGPNGSGKSTLLNAITNLISFDNGEVSILGLSNKNINVFREISYLKDNSVLYPYLTGRDHLNYIRDLQKLSDDRVNAVIEKIGIGEYVNKQVKKYSLGMKQHLLIALAILNSPKLLIMDEPLTGLDPDSVLDVRYLIQELYEDGVTILLSSHSLSEIDYITDDILFLSEGRIFQEDVSFYKKTEYIFQFEDEKDKNDFTDSIEKSEWNRNLEIKDKEVYIPIDANDSANLMKYIIENNLKFLSVKTHQRGAEERYRELFK